MFSYPIIQKRARRKHQKSWSFSATFNKEEDAANSKAPITHHLCASRILSLSAISKLPHKHHSKLSSPPAAGLSCRPAAHASLLTVPRRRHSTLSPRAAAEAVWQACVGSGRRVWARLIAPQQKIAESPGARPFPAARVSQCERRRAARAWKRGRGGCDRAGCSFDGRDRASHGARV